MATETTIKALNIIKELDRVSAAEFARRMWPDSNMHKKVSNQGNGSCRGKAAWLCGGSYLAKLAKKKLIRYSTALETYILTKDGEALIKNGF